MLLALTIICGIAAALFGLFAALATLLDRTSTDEGSAEEEESLRRFRDYAQVMGSVARYSAIAFAIGFVVLLVLLAS